LAGLWALAVPLTQPDQLPLAVVGMSACLGAVVRAPVTGILIVFEMTHEFSLVPALMIGALVSQAVSRNLNRRSFYEEIFRHNAQRIEAVIMLTMLNSCKECLMSVIDTFHAVAVQNGCLLAHIEKIVTTRP